MPSLASFECSVIDAGDIIEMSGRAINGVGGVEYGLEGYSK